MSVKVLEETLNKVFTSMTDGKANSKGSGSFSFIDSA